MSEKLTLGEYLTTRRLPVQQTRLRASTYDSYRRNIDLHVIPALGELPLDRLTAEDIDLFYASLLKNGSKKRTKKPDGEQAEPKGLSPKSVHNIHVMLNKALSDAARKGTVVRNVVALADAPSLQARKRAEIKAWDVDQLVRFLDEIASHRLSPAFFLAAHTGMRRGELLGLRWRDLDLDANRVAVRQALVSVAYEVSISDVKTGTSRRTIDIDADVVGVLRDWLKARAGERDGIEPAADDLVFTKDDGSWLHPDTFSQLFDRTVARIGVPVISLPSLTHPRHLAVAGGSEREGGERAARSRQRRVHDERVPARPARHAGRRGRHLLAAAPQPA